MKLIGIVLIVRRLSKSLVAMNFAIRANTPKGVNLITKATIFITISCNDCIIFTKNSNTSGFFFLSPNAEEPTKAAKNTTESVGAPPIPASAANGFVGIISNNC